MSFSADVKSELCRSSAKKRCCAVAEAYGVLLYCSYFSQREARIITGNDAFAAVLPRLFRRAFGVSFDREPPEGASGKRSFVISDPDKLETIFQAFGLDSRGSLSLHINLGVLENECCRAAFLRGAFLAGGSMTDPGKRYHLELTTAHLSVSRELYSLLLEFGFEPRSIRRGSSYITYFKQSETISDLLTAIGAPVSAMRLMSARIEKDMRNEINRKVNCDSANADKTVEAAAQQLTAIRKLQNGAGLDSLAPKLREAALLRLHNPEASLTDLAALCDPPVSKSCVNHRLKRIMELAEKE